MTKRGHEHDCQCLGCKVARGESDDEQAPIEMLGWWVVLVVAIFGVLLAWINHPLAWINHPL